MHRSSIALVYQAQQYCFVVTLALASNYLTKALAFWMDNLECTNNVSQINLNVCEAHYKGLSFQS